MNMADITPRTPFPLNSPWVGHDPFLFTAFHEDDYPAGDEGMGPVTGTAGRRIGSDFSGQDGWNMYYGEKVPGFPSHPHRGFETITLVTRGLVDHTDSLGASARYGDGDVQWLTSGKGISHSEMFPLLDADEPNPLQLFQIWLNLPPESKNADPEFTMQWTEEIPVALGEGTRVKVIAGTLEGVEALDPPSNSWATRPEADVAVWLIDIAPGSRLPLPAAATEQTTRTLYVYAGGAQVNGTDVPEMHGYLQVGREKTELVAGEEPVHALLLQGVPIGAPVVQRGPFVANSEDELRQAFLDYQQTQFGGWPWPTFEETFPREEARFARLVDGTELRPSEGGPA